MGCNDYIVFSDIDGTLLDSHRQMLPGTRSALRTLAERGITFAIVSARSPSGIFTIQEEFQLSCPIISYSGALIMDENRKIIFSEGLSRETGAQIVDFVESFPFDCAWNVFSGDTWIVKKGRMSAYEREERIVRTESVEGSVWSLEEGAKIGKILCMCNPEDTVQIEGMLKEAFPDLYVARSSATYLEILAKDITKGTGVQALCHLLDVPKENTVAFGDQYNDIEMLEAVAMPFLMGNAPEELKARFPVTDDNDHEGIYMP